MYYVTCTREIIYAPNIFKTHKLFFEFPFAFALSRVTSRVRAPSLFYLLITFRITFLQNENVRRSLHNSCARLLLFFASKIYIYIYQKYITVAVDNLLTADNKFTARSVTFQFRSDEKNSHFFRHLIRWIDTNNSS